MRWLFLKDLEIMRRSPLVSTLLVLYPIAIAVLIGFSLSRAPGKPRVAFLNEVPEAQQLQIGGGDLDKGIAKDRLCSRVDCIDVSTRAQAEQLVADGDVLAALILPPDLLDKLQSLASLNPESPTVEVLVNEEDPLKAQLVEDRIQSLITEANLVLSQQVSDQAKTYLGLLLKGGTFNLLGQSFDILGLQRSGETLQRIRRQVPQGPSRDALDQVIRFADLARQNLDLALPLLSSVAEPIHVDTTVVNGGAPSLDSFAIAVAATVTLMFVTVLLVAGSLALEREENTFPRLTRGLVGRTALLGEKLLLGVGVSLVVTLVMLGGLELFLNLDWARFPLFLVAILAGGLGFAAFGAAIGSAAREVRASSLLAFMISLPVAFLSLVSSGTVSPTLFHAIEVVRALFPFDAALDAMSGALDSGGPAIALPVLHLAILALAYATLSRLALRRFVL
jgi:ABC-type multidrug transport system permease subunit